LSSFAPRLFNVLMTRHKLPMKRILTWGQV
jgi:hypothetical protein